MVKKNPLLALLVLIPLLLASTLGGCSGGGAAIAFVTLSERVSYGPGGVLAFAAWGLQIRYVRTINEAGGALRTLTNSDGDQDFTDEGGFQPTYSPNGATIAMTSRRGTSEDIFTMPAAGDTNGVTPLTNNPASDQQPSWAPTGDKLLFTSNRTAGVNGIWEVATAAPFVATPIVDTGANEQWASYNPAGDRVVFQREVAPGDTEIVVLDVGAATETVLASSPAREEHPAWSHDGTKVAFMSNRAGDPDIWVINADGTNLTQLTNDSASDGYPQWKPEDSSKIVFHRAREVWTMDADGTNQDQLTRVS